MQINDIDNDSEHLSDTREGDVRGPTGGYAAVHELNQIRAEALRHIDKDSFSRFQLKLCFVAGTGFFTDAYDIFAINLASVMLEYIYGHTPGPGLTQRLSPNEDLWIKVAAPVGTLFAQLLFGWLTDIVGRKRMYGIEQLIILISTFAQAFAGFGPGLNIIAVLIVWRFIMGMGAGLGGVHPLSAVFSSGFASTSSRGRLMTMVFTAQGWGYFAAAIVAPMTVKAYKDTILSDNFNDLKYLDYCWRILIGLGCVPGAIALYFRLTVPETPRFTIDIDRDIQKARAEIENVLGPNGSSAAVYWVDPDVVVQRADAPRGRFAVNASPILYIGWRYAIADLPPPSTGCILCTSLPYLGSEDNPVSRLCHVDGVIGYPRSRWHVSWCSINPTFIILGKIFTKHYRSTAHEITGW